MDAGRPAGWIRHGSRTHIVQALFFSTYESHFHCSPSIAYRNSVRVSGNVWWHKRGNRAGSNKTQSFVGKSKFRSAMKHRLDRVNAGENTVIMSFCFALALFQSESERKSRTNWCYFITGHAQQTSDVTDRRACGTAVSRETTWTPIYRKFDSEKITES